MLSANPATFRSCQGLQGLTTDEKMAFLLVGLDQGVSIHRGPH